MASRTAYPATESAGDILTTTNFDKLPGGLIGYATATSNQTGITTITDLTSLSVTVTVNTSRLIKVVGSTVLQQATGAGTGSFFIRESSTTLQTRTYYLAVNAATTHGHAEVLIAAPSSGSHTYKLSLSVDANTIGSLASSTQPAFIAVYDLGPSF